MEKVFNCSLNDRDSIKATTANLEGWLRTVDKSGFPRRFKACIYQPGILPKTLWPLLVYKVPITVFEEHKQRVSSYLRRWLGLPCSLSNISLYGNTNKLRLPFSLVREEFIMAWARDHLQYPGCRVVNVCRAGIVMSIGRKWRAAEAVQQAETWQIHKDVLSTVAQGLGSISLTWYGSASGRERLVQEKVRTLLKAEQTSRAVATEQQGTWMKREQAIKRCVT